MRAEAQGHIDQINAATALLRRFLDWDRANRRLQELNAKVEDPTLWDDPKAAQEVMRERRRLEEAIGATQKIETELKDTIELIEMAEAGRRRRRWSTTASGRLASSPSGPNATRSRRCLPAKPTPTTAISRSMPAPAAPKANDWAGMLQRMYSRWAERHGMKVELVDHHAGEQAGIKSATMLIKGENAYGNLKVESGVHRLVRISPYDSPPGATPASPRSGSIRKSTTTSTSRSTRCELRIDTYRASGRGRPARQHDRQRGSDHPHSDRDRRRLPERTLAAQEPRPGDEAVEGANVRGGTAEARGGGRCANAAKTDIGWGHQIRSYVLQPYQLVKDLRTGVTSTAPTDVLDGDLDRFMAAALSQRVTGEKVEVEDVE